MAKYDYREGIDELDQERIVPARYVFFYEQHRLAICYEQMFQFAQVNLSEVCLADNYNIEPARFYYLDCSDINACAIFDQGYYLIEINRGTLEQLYSLFCDNGDILNDTELVDYQSLNRILESNPHNVSLSYLIYQTATLFTYYHELGHLIQYANQINGTAEDELTRSVQERYMANAALTFKVINHITEYDADLHGANNIAFHLFNLWDKMGPEKTEENLIKLTVASMVSIMGYITLLWGFDNNLYYREHSHPHPLIRIFWILTVVVDRVQAIQPNIDQRALITEAMRVLDIYYRHLGQVDVQEKLIDPLRQHYPRIMAYAGEIINQSQAVPFLASNTVHKRPRQ